MVASVPAFTPEQLTQLRVAAEHLLELPEAEQWDARGHERRVDEAKVKLAVFGLLNAANKAVGIRALADLVRQAEATAGADGKLSPDVKDVVYAALMRQIPAEALEEHVPHIVEALGHAALRSENASRELLGLEPIESLAKQAEFVYTGTALQFANRWPGMLSNVQAYMANAVGNHALAVSASLVSAANPANPIGIGPLQQQLRGEVSNLTVKRATTIARTETARVYGATARGTFKTNGMERARLVTAGDPCSDCEAIASRGFVDIDDLEELPIHPNCRCDYIPDVEKWLPEKRREGFEGELPYFDDVHPMSFQGAVNSWTYKEQAKGIQEASKLLMRNPRAYDMELEAHRHAAGILNAIGKSDKHARLYRGMGLSEDGAKAFMTEMEAKVGGVMDLPLTSFSTSVDHALKFTSGQIYGPGGPAGAATNPVTVWFRGLNMQGASIPGDVLEEIVVAGRFTVVSVTRVKNHIQVVVEGV